MIFSIVTFTTMVLIQYFWEMVDNISIIYWYLYNLRLQSQRILRFWNIIMHVKSFIFKDNISEKKKLTREEARIYFWLKIIV